MIQDGETPEQIAYKLYGSVNYHWVIMITNSIVNISKEWPLSSNVLSNYIESKYDDIYAIHHYEDDGVVIDKPPGISGLELDRLAVSNYDHEVKINDDKSKINVIHSTYLKQFISEFKETINGPKIVKSFRKAT